MYPEAHVFWIYAGTRDRYLQAYKEIARKLLIPGWNDPEAHTLQIVCEWFMDERNGRWLIVLDNADDLEMFYPSGNLNVNVRDTEEGAILRYFLPSRAKGSILITTRDKTAGRNLANGQEPIAVCSMTADEERAMLLSRVPDISRKVIWRNRLSNLDMYHSQLRKQQLSSARTT